MNSKINVSVIGASGYSGEELIRILLGHPSCRLSRLTSRKYSGRKIGEVFPRFAGSEICFSDPDADSVASDSEVVFLALPHGLAAEFAAPLFAAGVTVIDISADFRLKDTDKYSSYYGAKHPAPELLSKSVYGLPEHYREEIKNAKLVACPGCYPTSILLPMIPLLKAGAVSGRGISICSMSGVTGAGRKVDLPFIFPECNESLRAYSPCGHRHLPEIEQELALASGDSSVTVNFVPHLAPVNRGICSTVIAEIADEGIGPAELLSEYYSDEPFVRVLGTGSMPDTKNVTFTNFCEIGAVRDEHTGRVIVSSCIDNLTKGASGQAVQCMNIAFGLDETEGLLL